MKRVQFKELLCSTDEDIECASEIKNLVLKQVSRGRFEDCDMEIVAKVICLGEMVEVVFTNDVSVREFRKALHFAYNGEPSLDFMYDSTVMCDSTLIQMMIEYRNNYYVLGSNLGDEVWFKLYSDIEIKSDLRNKYQAGWIDYEKQLEDGDIIYDELGLSGLWAMPRSMLLSSLNQECVERYGNRLLVLKPVDNCCYLNDGKEIIGDRFKVVDKIDFFNISDLGRLIKTLQQIDNRITETEKAELEKRISLLYEEKTHCIDEIIAIRKNLLSVKYRYLAFFLIGVFLGLLFETLI